MLAGTLDQQSVEGGLDASQFGRDVLTKVGTIAQSLRLNATDHTLAWSTN